MSSRTAVDEHPSTCTCTRTCINLKSVQWTDVLEDDNGKARGILGVEWNDFSSKQLRTICSRLSVRGVKNAKKHEMVERLITMYDNHKTGYQELQSRDRAKGKPPRQQVQCSFRLINVLFSDNFAGDLVTNLGNVASSKHHLDTDTVVNEEHFWLQVRAAFIVPNPEYDSIRFAEDIVFLQEPPIDPSNIVPHDWQKLRSIWKDLISEYMAAMTRFTQSRTQRDMNFYNFCNGKADVYYLKKNLEQRPGLNYMLEADQSEEESSLSSDMIGNRKSPRSTNSSKRKWCEDESEHEIADAIRDFSNSARLSELAKLKIYFMEKEDRRRQHQFAFDEWGNIQTLLRSLREDVKNCVDDVIKAELEDDIKGLVQRKKKLSTELGFH